MGKVFTFDAPAFEITKSYRDDNGQMFIEGIASTVAIDQTGERMSPEVIAKMAARLVGKPLRDEHQKGWYDKLGEIIQADVVDNLGHPALWIKARLYDWSTKARDLFGMLKQEGAKMGLSVAGKINPGGLVRELVESVGKYIPTYKDVEPTEVSVTDHPANLDTFAVAVAKSLDLDNYDPDEYKKQDMCEHGLVKKECSKCMTKMGIEGAGAIPESKLAEQDLEGKKETSTEKHDLDPLAPADFLDYDNRRFPADEKHIMPLLRYYNQDNQRKSEGYDDAKWSDMGTKLAAKLNRVTGETYKYDSSSEKVVRGESTEKEVNTMTDKGNLVSKNVPDEVKKLAKEWGRDIDSEVKKTEVKADEKTVEKVTDKKEEKKEVKKETPSSFSAPSISSGSSSSDSSSSDSSSGSSSSGSTSNISSEMSSLMSELKSTLDAIKDSLSSAGSSSSDSSDSSSSDSSSSGSSSSSDKTSTDKAAEDSASSASSNEDEMARAIDTLVQAANTMKEIMAKKVGGKKVGAKPNLKDQDDEAASDYDTSDNTQGKVEGRAANKSANGGETSPKGAKPSLKDQDKEEASSYTSSENAPSIGKALVEALSLMNEMQKRLAKRDEEFTKLVEKHEAPQDRKGVAITLEKRFTGHEDVGVKTDNDEVYSKLMADKRSTFQDLMKYRDSGGQMFPTWFKKE